MCDKSALDYVGIFQTDFLQVVIQHYTINVQLHIILPILTDSISRVHK